MSAISVKFKSALKAAGGVLWPEYYYRLTPAMSAVLRQSRLIVADAGSCGGPDVRWLPLKGLVHFLAFEPDARSSQTSPDANCTYFAVGLGRRKETRPLHLTQFPPASSLYPLNQERLKDFANREWHQVTGSSLIPLDTMDACLADRPDLAPDFLKVDVEGADLDVLNGASGLLAAGILGVQAEVTFLERHLGAPFFGETDQFLRSRGYELFALLRERWLRTNRTYGANSNPQIVWADAVYFLNRESMLRRLQESSPDGRRILLVKFVTLLLCYGAHDYAVEITDAARSAGLADAADAEDLKRAVEQSVRGFADVLIRSALGAVLSLCLWIVSLPFARARNRALQYLKRHVSECSDALSRFSNRCGVNGSCVPDAR